MYSCCMLEAPFGDIPCGGFQRPRLLHHREEAPIRRCSELRFPPAVYPTAARSSVFQQRSIPTLLGASSMTQSVTFPLPSWLGGLFPFLDHSRACSAAVLPIFGASSALRLVEALVIYDDMYRGPADWLLRSRH